MFVDIDGKSAEFSHGEAVNEGENALGLRWKFPLLANDEGNWREKLNEAKIEA